MRTPRWTPILFWLVAAILLIGSKADAAKPGVKPPTAGCPACEIAYTQANNYTTGPQDLMLMMKDGSSKTLLLAGGGGVLHKAPTWAPDGKWIAFITNADPRSTLRLIRSDGTGLTDIVERCTGAFTNPAWSPVLSGGGYWLVYTAARGADGDCITEPAPGIGWPSLNLWAVHVSLGTPVLFGDPVCLSCAMNPDNQDLWSSHAWTRDGTHFSSLRRRYDASGMTPSFFVFDVTFADGVPALVPSAPVELPGFVYPEAAAPSSWAHYRDSLLLRKKDAATGTSSLLRLDFDFAGDHAVTGTEVLTSGTSHNFIGAVWSPDDTRLVYDGNGIYVITLAPFSPVLIAPNKPKMVDAPDWRPLVP